MISINRALELTEKRVKCLKLISSNRCNLNCGLCQYHVQIARGETAQEEYEAFDMVYNIAKEAVSTKSTLPEEEKASCKYCSPCGLCDKLSDAYGLPTKCTERGNNNARNS